MHNVLALFGLFLSSSCFWSGSAASAADQVQADAAMITPHPMLPKSCTTWFRRPPAFSTHSCYTYTETTTPRFCPKQQCPIQTDLVCPQYIVVTTLNVPCNTNCCPVTPTVYSTKTCPGCPKGCVIPTVTDTITTGCKTTTSPTIFIDPIYTSGAKVKPGNQTPE
ncbi:hypothetical protein B0T17DRAFT_504454 [Bombardia bombarda]|uniref:Uncharacterized protein n=1 Tax=Bombardia bombarda TaxID=252184 RepID=A0AA39XNV7_9PEZI|nr:hypothetical protein B0T17DRAFT_504454 [Bombardia bombarda]